MTAPQRPQDARHAPNSTDPAPEGTPAENGPQTGTQGRDHRHPQCPRCTTVWHQAGNRTGHCSGCHRTFDSLTAFEQHIVGDGADRRCLTIDEILAAKRPDGGWTFLSRRGTGPHDSGTVYWRLALTEQQAERFERLKAEHAEATS